MRERPVDVEIERKYLLRELPRFPKPVAILEVDQGYLPGTKVLERVRREQSDAGVVRFFRTMKVGSGVERLEFEDETDEALFKHLWVLTEGRRVKKRRYVVLNGGDRWEIDEFLDRSLALAELELERADSPVTIPDWLKPVLVREVTDEVGYTNRSLAR
jgi:CYTH domain-containing protein